MALALEERNGTRLTSGLPPGPRMPGAAQTVWYVFDQPGFFRECRARFGRTFTTRLAGFPPVVVTSDRASIKRVFTGDPLARQQGNDLFKPLFGERSLMTIGPVEHLARRRLELPPFHGDAIRGYAERIRELANEEIGSWRAGATVATHLRAQQLTMKVILELVLGVRDEQLRRRLSSVFESFQTPLNNLALFSPEWARTRAKWNRVAEPIYHRIDRLRDLLVEHIDRTRQDPDLTRRSDVLALLVRARDERGEMLSDVDLRDDLVTLVAAGHETTAAAIGWACDLLAHHPEVVERLRQDDPGYLRATVKEVLRARTVAYAAAARVPLEPIRVEEWNVGADAMILVDAQGVHGDADVYPEPEAFQPERFLGEQPDGYSYIPFGGGAHRCLGAQLALLEIEQFVQALVSDVGFTAAGPPAQPHRRGPILAPGNHGRIRIT